VLRPDRAAAKDTDGPLRDLEYVLLTGSSYKSEETMREETTGDSKPISLHKRSVAMNYRSVNRSGNQSSYRQVGEPDGMGFSRIKSESIGEGNRSFAQDFNMEHSRSAGAAKGKNISVGCGAVERGKSRSGHADPMNLPSCVYLG
jgi:hypothetical protein